MFNKHQSSSKPVASKPQAKAPAAEGKSLPSHSLVYSEGEGSELVKLTGLFANSSKSGKSYLSVKVKESITIPAGATLMLFENTPKN